jgi:hypothetical protein
VNQHTQRRTGRATIARRLRLPGLFLVTLLLFFAACQTPPKKTNKTSPARTQSASNTGTTSPTAAESAFDLFSASTERFGSDPRTTRPVIVSDTVWIMVVGSVFLITGVALVSSIRGTRGGRPRRRT